MNNASVVAGWVGLSGALVIGYGAYKNKPVFGKGGIVTQAIQTGKVGTGTSGKSGGTAPGVSVPNHSIYMPGRGWVDPAPPVAATTSAPVAPPAPPAPTTSNPFSGLLNALKGLFGGTPTTTGVYV